MEVFAAVGATCPPSPPPSYEKGPYSVSARNECRPSGRPHPTQRYLAPIDDMPPANAPQRVCAKVIIDRVRRLLELVCPRQTDREWRREAAKPGVPAGAVYLNDHIASFKYAPSAV